LSARDQQKENRQVIYIETKSTDAAFHFSVEQHCMKRFPGETVFMLWQADNFVMLGSNQIADAEIDLREAERHGVRIVRRASGGGAIYTDMGTLLCSVVMDHEADRDAKQAAGEMMVKPILDALAHMGVEARPEGRNDILVNGAKISGMAQYVHRGRLCSHCSLLFDADLDMLARVLRADEEKIHSKALRSMRARVGNIAEQLRGGGSLRDFRELLRRCLFERDPPAAYELTDEDMERISGIYREKFGSPDWTYGRTPPFSFRNSKRFAGGKLEFLIEVEKGLVRNCKIYGDFLALIPVRPLEERIEGLPYRRADVAARLETTELGPYIGNITLDEFLSGMFA
jgi:lipoate-protein ligase A